MEHLISGSSIPDFKLQEARTIWTGTRQQLAAQPGDIAAAERLLFLTMALKNALGKQGSGHQAAQDRLGAGRVYHCMNSVGQMWRAFDLMVRRAMEREVHGGKLETKQFIQGFIADSYMDIQASRLMTIRCAELMEQGVDARTDISAIKIFVPAAMHRVVDRAIQVHGALGVSAELPLEAMYRGARTLRLADGPDEVHKILIAKNVLKHYHSGDSWDFGI